MLVDYALAKGLEDLEKVVSELQNRIHNIEKDVAELKKKVQSTQG